VSAAPGVDEPRFRDALRGLPGRVWTVSLGILVNQVGNFLPVFIVLYLTGRGYSAGAAGLVLGASGVGKVLGNAAGGYLADRIGRRWTIVLSAVTTAGLTAAVPFLGPLPLIVAVVGLVGVTSQIYRPAAAAVLVDAVSTDRQRLAAFGVFRFAMNIGAALGGVIGGVLASTSYVGLFLANAAACLLFGVVVAAFMIFCYLDGLSAALAFTFFVNLWTIQPGSNIPVFVIPVVLLVTMWAPRSEPRIEDT
jgi:MFS family permease